MNTISKLASFITLACMLALGITLTATVPRTINQAIEVDIRCSSGRSIAGVYISAEVSKSDFAQRTDGDPPEFERFSFSLNFGGAYQVRVGCGGTPNGDWELSAHSTSSEGKFRRIVCDDTKAVGDTPGPCIDA